MNMQSVLKPGFQFEITAKPAAGLVAVLAASSASRRKNDFKKIIETNAPPAQKSHLLAQSEKRQLHFSGIHGPVWILQAPPAARGGHGGLLDDSVYAWFRDQAGSLVAPLRSQLLADAAVCFYGAPAAAVRGVIVGFEMASYNFLNTLNGTDVKNPVLKLSAAGTKGFKLDAKFLALAQAEARAVQLARHLVNLPPNMINPQTVEELVTKGFPKGTKIEVWNSARLAAENMNLLLAVGQGSETPARMIRIRHRPSKKSSKKPIAFVGKGITFDTGGLDIKPSSAMRLMKKDMGGAAAVLGLAHWAVHTNYPRACDFYLALAENSVDGKAMRPSDLYRSRAGFLVEIDNTDAEGRLVLADVMDVAAKQKGADEPEFLIDVATLTGAIKVALGAEVAGLFANDDQLARQLQAAGQAAGDLNWRMPLMQKYFSGMSSNFADFKNSADGFGGAITAALFLEKFCAGKKWAHLDVYSWNDKPTGALGFAGGSGQPVQALMEWLKGRA